MYIHTKNSLSFSLGRTSYFNAPSYFPKTINLAGVKVQAAFIVPRSQGPDLFLNLVSIFRISSDRTIGPTSDPAPGNGGRPC